MSSGSFQYSGQDISKNDADLIIKISDDLYTNEKEAIRLWIDSDNADNRRAAESLFSLPTKSLDGNLSDAAKMLFRLERKCLIDAILELFKHRGASVPKIEHIVATNQLIKNKLFENIAKSLSQAVDEWIRATNSAGAFTPQYKYMSNPSDGIILAQILYFIAYTTDLTEVELIVLSDILRKLSSAVIMKPPPSSVSDSVGSNFYDPTSYGSDTIDRAAYIAYMKTVEEWKRSGIVVLSLLQLTLSCALLPSVGKLSRDASPATDVSSAIVAAAGQGTPSKSPFSADTARTHVHGSSDTSWKSSGAKGFACLVLAIHAQSLVEDSAEVSSDLLSYLKEASRLRAYSYIRLCILPVIEHCVTESSVSPSYVNSAVVTNFLTDTLQSFMVELSNLFSIYNNMSLFITTTNIDNVKEKTPTLDCLDDLMNMISSSCNRLCTLPMVLVNNTLGGAQPYSYHPFFLQSISWKDPYLMLASFRLLGAVGRFIWSVPESWQSRIGSNSMGVYQYMRDRPGPRHEVSIWDFIFNDCINPFAESLRGLDRTQGAGIQPGEEFLSEIDRDLLISVADLIANIARCPRVAIALQKDYNAVSRLFDLASCPVSIFLKGALFKAIASLAHGSEECAKDAWVQLEHHNLLKFASNVALNRDLSVQPWQRQNSSLALTDPYYSNGGQQDYQAVLWSAPSQTPTSGLRFELDATESTAGVYPSTEGFLTLIESLLSHGTPDLLGKDYRIPGIVLYLEFIVDDVLGKINRRKYAPQGFMGQSQRWRITARVIRILSIILQYYRVNTVAEDYSTVQIQDLLKSISELSGSAASLKDLCNVHPILDFLVTDNVTFKTTREDGTVIFQTSQRPKTAGFFVMALLFSGGHSQAKLLNHVLTLLKECSISDIMRSHNIMSMTTAEEAVSIITIMQPPDRVPALYGIDENLSRISLTPESGCLCDGSYWQEKVASACIGLLYECALREEIFNYKIRHSSFPITFLRTEQGRPVAVILSPYGLIESLSSGIHLAKIAHFLQLSPRQGLGICLPSVASMVISLLEHVALSQSAHTLLGSMMDTPEGEQSVIMACVDCIFASTDSHLDSILQGDIGKLAFDYGSLYLFTPSKLASLKAPVSMATAIANLVENGNISDSISGKSSDNVKEYMLNLILTSLSPNNICFGHMLLGLRKCLEKVLHVRADPAQVAALLPDPIAREPKNCLQAIIEILSVGDDVSESLILTQPSIALLSYELLYKLCSVPLSSALILNYLRKPTVDFVSKQIRLFLNLLILSDEDIASIASNNKDSYSLSVAQAQDAGLDYMQAVIDEIKMARHHCLGWLLQICTLELRSLEISTGDISSSKIRLILNVLYSSEWLQSSVPTLEVQLAPLTHLLSNAFDMPGEDFPSVSSKLIISCLEDSTVPYIVGRESVNIIADSTFTVVDIAKFMKSITSKQAVFAPGSVTRSDIEIGLRAAYTMNFYQRRMAATTHLTRAWGQLISVSFIGIVGFELTQLSGSTLGESTDCLLESLVLPTLRMLTTVGNLEMIMCERLMQSIVLVLSVIHRNSESIDLNVHSSASVCSKKQHEELLTLFLDILLRGSKVAGFVKQSSANKPTSHFFRGLIYSGINISLSWSRPKHGSVDLFDKSIKEVQQRLIGSVISEFVLLVCNDCHAGPVIWQLVSIATLQSVLDLLWVNTPSAVVADDASELPVLSPLDRLVQQSFFRTLQLVFEKGGIQLIMNNGLVGQNNHSSLAIVSYQDITGSGPTKRNSNHSDNSMFENTVSLCVNLSRSLEGADELIKHGILSILVDLDKFVNPLPNLIEDNFFSDSAFSETHADLKAILASKNQRNFQDQFLMVINLLYSLVSHSLSRPVMQGCLQFLRKNQMTVTHFLRMRTMTLKGLQVTQALVRLISICAQHSNITLRNGTSMSASMSGNDILDQITDNSMNLTSATSAQEYLFEIVLGQFSDSFTSDIVRLMHRIGMNPSPKTGIYNPMNEWITGGLNDTIDDKKSDWWLKILPVLGTEDDYLVNTYVKSSEINGGSQSHSDECTLFDNMKYQCGLDILVSSSIFLHNKVTAICQVRNLNVMASNVPRKNQRIQESYAVTSKVLSSASLLSIDFQLVAKTFHSCSSTLVKLKSSEGKESESNSSALTWLRSEEEVLLSGKYDSNSYVLSYDIPSKSFQSSVFNTAAESLISVIYILVTAALSSEDYRQVQVWKKDIDLCIRAAENWPSHSFVRQVVQWITDRLDSA